MCKIPLIVPLENVQLPSDLRKDMKGDKMIMTIDSMTGLSAALNKAFPIKLDLGDGICVIERKKNVDKGDILLPSPNIRIEGARIVYGWYVAMQELKLSNPSLVLSIQGVGYMSVHEVIDQALNVHKGMSQKDRIRILQRQ